MSSSNCCFSNCIQVSQEGGQVVWYSYLLKNFPQFFVIHIIKVFSIGNKAEIDVFSQNSLAFSMIQQVLEIWSLVPLPFLNPAWTSRSSQFMYCWSLAWRILSIYFASVWADCSRVVVWTFFGIAFFGDLKENWLFQIFWHIECSTFTAAPSHHLSGFERAQLEFHHLH